jgi:hypothetical protein
MGIAVKRKHSIRKVYEAKRGSATVQGLADCKKQHTAHIKEQHKERCGWEVGEWRRVSWCSQLGAQVGVGKESEVVLKVGVRYCSRQCSRGESVRESDVVLALGG